MEKSYDTYLNTKRNMTDRDKRDPRLLIINNKDKIMSPSNFKAQTSLSSVVARNILMGKSAKAFSNNNKNDLDVEMKVAFGTFSSAKWQMIL